MTDDSVAAELRRRAVLLATPPASPEPGDAFEVLIFGWDGARYALPASVVRRTMHDVKVASLPRASASLLGAVGVRSQAVPVIDLRPLLDLRAEPSTVRHVVVLDDGDRSSLALAADQLERLATWQASDLHRPAHAPPLVRAIVSEGITLLDVDQLLDLPPFFSSTGGTP